MILGIAAKELRTMFYSPLAWALLCAVQLVVAFIFLQDLSNYIDQQKYKRNQPRRCQPCSNGKNVCCRWFHYDSRGSFNDDAPGC